LGAALGGDYDPTASGAAPRFQGALQVGLGIGLGVEGLTTRATDGVFFLQGEAIAYGAETYATGTCGACTRAPTRFGWGIRAHIPFYVIPGDTAILAPLLGLAKPDGLLNLALKAAQGSVWWRFERVRPGPGSGLSWQVLFGREAAAYWSNAPGFRMLDLDVPFVELRTNHLFSGRLGGDASLQIGASLELVRRWPDVVAAQERDTLAGSGFLRVAFDGLYYAVP
jgi:hypothetical protein